MPVGAPLLVDVWACRPHYLDHLAPVWAALPAHLRGRVVVDASGTLVSHAESLGMGPVSTEPSPWESVRVISSAVDRHRLPEGWGPIVYVEHGVGQSYGRSWVPAGVSAVCTNRAAYATHAAAGWRTYLTGPPKLDAWHRDGPPRGPDAGVVAFSAHWSDPTCPETTPAWPWIEPAVEAWAAEHGRAIGHCHPASRDYDHRRAWFTDRGIPFLDNFADVLEAADVYVADNTSTLYEWAATGRPVVALSPPWYRRHIHHDPNPRFWAHVPGPQVSHPSELAAVIEEAAADHPARRAKRVRAVAAAYGVLDGGAAGRVAAVVAAVADGTIPAMPERHPKADAYFRLPARMWLDALGRPTTRRADGVRLLGRGGSPLPWDVAYDLGLADPPPEPGDAFHTMTVARLRELARLSGLPTSGSKAQLVARLRQDHTDDPTTRQVPPRTKATA